MSVPLAVTTAVKPTPEIEAQGQRLAGELQAPFILRAARPLNEIFTASGARRLLIVGTNRLRLRDQVSATEYFFHPNMFLIRGSNALRGEPDHFLEATGLRPSDRILDCTLGFASEAGLASLIVGETGHVDGLESVAELAAVTRLGLQTFPMQSPILGAALRRIQVITEDYRSYLSICEAGQYDVVYFDPFFQKRLTGSEASVSPLFVFGNPTPLDAVAVQKACEVARRRVVIKHPRYEPLPEEVAAQVTETVGSRKSRLVYSILPGQTGR